jgi:cardiolipin synthase
MIGSSNMNHRSVLHDLEVDLVLHQLESIRDLERQFIHDCEQSVEKSFDDWQRRSYWKKLMEHFFAKLRYWT